MQRCLHLLQPTLTSLHFYFQNWSPAQTSSCRCQSLQHSLNFRSFLQAIPCTFPTQLLGLVFCHWLSAIPPRPTLQVPTEKQTAATAVSLSQFVTAVHTVHKLTSKSNSWKRQVCCALSPKRLFSQYHAIYFIAKTLSPTCTPSHPSPSF